MRDIGMNPLRMLALQSFVGNAPSQDKEIITGNATLTDELRVSIADVPWPRSLLLRHSVIPAVAAATVAAPIATRGVTALNYSPVSTFDFPTLLRAF